MLFDSTYTQTELSTAKSATFLGPTLPVRTCSIASLDPPVALRCLDERGRGNENEKNGIFLGGESRRRDKIPSSPDAARANKGGR